MNAKINTLLLAGNTFMPEMYLRQPRFTYWEIHLCLKCILDSLDLDTELVVLPLKIKKEYTNLRTFFIKMNKIKLVFNMI